MKDSLAHIITYTTFGEGEQRSSGELRVGSWEEAQIMLDQFRELQPEAEYQLEEEQLEKEGNQDSHQATQVDFTIQEDADHIYIEMDQTALSTDLEAEVRPEEDSRAEPSATSEGIVTQKTDVTKVVEVRPENQRK